jgi:hypothetical protein
MKTLILALFMLSFKLSALDVYHLHLKRLYKISNIGTPAQTQTEIATWVYDFAYTEDAVAYQSSRELHLITATEKIRIAGDIDSFKFSGEALVYVKDGALYSYSTLSKKTTLITEEVMKYDVKDNQIVFTKEPGSLFLIGLDEEVAIEVVKERVGQFKLYN